MHLCESQPGKFGDMSLTWRTYWTAALIGYLHKVYDIRQPPLDVELLNPVFIQRGHSQYKAPPQTLKPPQALHISLEAPRGGHPIARDLKLPSPNSKLLSLPPELRPVICGMVLFSGIIRPFANDNCDELSRLALLRTSKSIYFECKPLLSLSTFRFSQPKSLKSFLTCQSNDPLRHVPITSIELSFGWSVCNREKVTQKSNEEEEVRRQDEDYEDEGTDGVREESSSSIAKRGRQLRKFYYTRFTWTPMVNIVLNELRPRRLTIDFKNCGDCEECTHCCSLYATALLSFRPGFAAGFVPEYFKIRGCSWVENRSTMSSVDHLFLALIRYWTALRAGEQFAVSSIAIWKSTLDYLIRCIDILGMV